MIVTLTGTNDFARTKALRELVEEFVAQHGDLALERLDGGEVTADQLQGALLSLPFLAAKKLVVVRDLSTNKDAIENLEQLFDGLPETTEVIMVETKLDKRSVYYKLLTKKTDFRDFSELDQAALAKWLVTIAGHRKGSISLADARYLVERVGTDQQLLANEIEKLLLYNPAITQQTINTLTEASPQSTIFALLEAAFAGNQRRTLDLYAEQRAQKVEPQQIIAMLAWQLQTLAVSKTAGDKDLGEIAKEAKLNPYVLRKNQALTRRLSQAQIAKLVKTLLDIDIATKRSKIDADEALQHYLLQLA